MGRFLSITSSLTCPPFLDGPQASSIWPGLACLDVINQAALWPEANDSRVVLWWVWKEHGNWVDHQIAMLLFRCIFSLLVLFCPGSLLFCHIAMPFLQFSCAVFHTIWDHSSCNLQTNFLFRCIFHYWFCFVPAVCCFATSLCPFNNFHVLYFRPYEIIAVATCKGIAVWHVGFNPESDGRLSTENTALLPGHNGEVRIRNNLAWNCCLLS